MRPDGLNVSKMNVSYGGAVTVMRDTTVSEIGPYPSVFQVGDTQSLAFKDSDDGPFWMDENDRSKTKNDVALSEVVTKKRTKLELLIELRKNGVDTTMKRFLKHELVALAIKNNIPVTYTQVDITKGWVNQPKGMLQILWQRGFIDASQVKTARSSRYSKDGSKGDFDDEGRLTGDREQYCLRSLLMKCSDFRSEVTDLEHLASELSTTQYSVVILFSPKFHCELAGEGVEYSWGASKRYYRSQPLSKKSLIRTLRN